MQGMVLELPGNSSSDVPVSAACVRQHTGSRNGVDSTEEETLFLVKVFTAAGAEITLSEVNTMYVTARNASMMQQDGFRMN